MVNETINAKRHPLWLEVVVFILMFLISSTMAGIIPAVYDMYVMFTDPEIYDKLEALVMSGDSTFSSMMDFVINMTDSMYIITLFCTAIVIGTIIFYCVKIEGRTIRSMGFIKRHCLRNYGIGMLVGLISFSLCVFLCNLTGVIHIKGINPNFNIGLVLLYFLGFLIQGMSEEVTFRGYFMISLMKEHTVKTAILVNALAFAIAHLMNPGLSIFALINLLLIGVFLSVYVIATGDIWGAAAYHSMWNFAQGTLYGISVSGTKVSSSVLETKVDQAPKILSGGSFGTEGSVLTTIVMGLFLLGMIVIINNKKNFQKN